jgi:hypothetical protein
LLHAKARAGLVALYPIVLYGERAFFI